jgi:hypothetical protein
MINNLAFVQKHLKFDDSSHQTDQKFYCSFKKNEYNKFNLNSNIRERYQIFKADLNLVKRNLLKPISEEERTNSSDSFNYIIVNKSILSQTQDHVENENYSSVSSNKICNIILFKLVTHINGKDTRKNKFNIVNSKKGLVQINETNENLANLKNDEISKINSGKTLNITPYSLDQTNDEEISNSNQNVALNIRSEKETNFKASEFNIESKSQIAENNSDKNNTENINQNLSILPKILIEEDNKKRNNKSDNKKGIHKKRSDKKNNINKLKCFEIHKKGKYSLLLEKNHLSKIEGTINSISNSLVSNNGYDKFDIDNYSRANHNQNDNMIPLKNIEDVNIKVSEERNDKLKDLENITSISKMPVDNDVYENLNSERKIIGDTYVYNINSNVKNKEILDENGITEKKETIDNEILDPNEVSSSEKSIKENESNNLHLINDEIVNEETEKVDSFQDLNKHVDHQHLNVNSNFYADKNKFINNLTDINETSYIDNEYYKISPQVNNENISKNEDTLVKNKEENLTHNKQIYFEVKKNYSEIQQDTEKDKELLNQLTNGNDYIFSEEGKNKTYTYDYKVLNGYDNNIEIILPSDSEDSKKIENVESIDYQRRNGCFHNFIEEYIDKIQDNQNLILPLIKEEKDKLLHVSDDQDCENIIADNEEKDSIINQTKVQERTNQIEKEYINDNIYCDYLNYQKIFPFVQEDNLFLLTRKSSQEIDTIKMKERSLGNLNKNEENERETSESLINKQPLEFEVNDKSNYHKDMENAFNNYKDIKITENVEDELMKTPLKEVKNLAEQLQKCEGYKISLNLDSLIKKFELLTNGERENVNINPFKEENLEEGQMKVTNLRENFEENCEIDNENFSNSNCLKENDYHRNEKEKVVEINCLKNDQGHHISDEKELVLYNTITKINNEGKQEIKDIFEDSNKITSHNQLHDCNLPETRVGDIANLNNNYKEEHQLSDTFKEEMNESCSFKNLSLDVIDKAIEDSDKNDNETENLEKNSMIIYVDLKYLRKRNNKEIDYKKIKCESVKVDFSLEKQRKNLKVKK